MAFSVLSPITDANSLEKNPKFTLIFERSKEISCSENQENIIIDFTYSYTTTFYNGIDSNKQCQFSISPSRQNFSVAKDNGLLNVHPQIFENNSWIRAAKSQLNLGGAYPYGYANYEKNKAGKDGRFRLSSPIPFPYVNPPISDEYKAKGYSHFFGLKAGSFCLEQTPGPLKIRYEIVNGKTTYFSNAVSISFLNYDKILYNGRCYSTSGINKLENNNTIQNSQPATSTPTTQKSVLKPCTTNENLALTQIARQNYPLAQRYSEAQMEYQKLDLDYQNASIAGQRSQMNRIDIQIEQIKRDINSLGKSIDNLSAKRKNILAKCDPKAQTGSAGNTKLTQCSQNQISLMRNLQNQYWSLMRQVDSYKSEISRLQESISAFTPMAEVARINFAIEDQYRYLEQPMTQASFAKKQFETANSSCLNSGISLD